MDIYKRLTNIPYKLVSTKEVVGEFFLNSTTSPDMDYVSKPGFDFVSETENILGKKLAEYKIGENDSTLLYYAYIYGGIILTGDRHLRKAAEEKGIEVHGTLWILKKAIQDNYLVCADAKELVKMMKRSNQWLPGMDLVSHYLGC